MTTAQYRQSDINAYIHGAQHITNMVQADLRLLQDMAYTPSAYERQEFIILIGNDEIE